MKRGWGIGAALLAFAATNAAADAPGWDQRMVVNELSYEVAEPYYAPPPPPVVVQPPAPIVAPAPVYVAPPENTYDTARYGGNQEFGHYPSAACGGLLEGEKCLVILDDHIRRLRLPRPAGTVVVGNPTVADVTVLGKETLFISARSTGSTNLIVLDENDDVIDTYEVYVRTPESRRVVMRHGVTRETYQCAPYCERTLNQADTPEPHQAQASIIQTELQVDNAALGLQQGANPNTDALFAENQGAQAALAAAAAAPRAGGAPAVGGGNPGAAALSRDLQALINATGAAQIAAGLGGGNSAAAQAPEKHSAAAQPAPAGGGGGFGAPAGAAQ